MQETWPQKGKKMQNDNVMEEMVSIPRISEFVEVMDSKANAFHHILKTRIGHNEQLGKEVLDFMENHGKFKDFDNSRTIHYMNSVIKPIFVSVVTGLFFQICTTNWNHAIKY
jgi:hypothetical protein